MAPQSDSTEPIRQKALSFESVVEGVSCNQSSFKVGKGSFLFLGPGAKGVAYKAMFKLDRSLDRARQLAEKEPGRFEVGRAGWVTARFSDEKPLPRSVWEKWIEESYGLATGGGPKATKKKSSRKR